MKRYLAQRLIGMVVVLLGITILTFAISQLVPVDPVLAIVGDYADEATIQAAREKWGLDRPLAERYYRYVWALLHGDLGTSIRTRRPVLTDLRQFFPATLELSTLALLVAISIGIPTGILSAIRRNSLIDHFSRIVSLAGISMPIFWLGLLASALFYYKLGLLPGGGRLSAEMAVPPPLTGLYTLDSLLAGKLDIFRDTLAHLILPASVLGSGGAGSIARLTRSSLLEVLLQDYVRTGRAKGLSERVVIMHHALRNALIPTVTVIGVVYGGMLSGAVLTETIFSWPGMGRYAVNSIKLVDLPAIMGVVLIMTIIYSTFNLIVDLLYGFLDPRIRLVD